VIAPTGTIGLVMDCDTTGIEPDFALVKFKKLAGGGYFKIINRSVPAALETLGYTSAQIEEIVAYAVGHGTHRQRAGHQPHLADRPRFRPGGDRKGRGGAAVRLRHPLRLQPVDAGRGVLHRCWASRRTSSTIRPSTCCASGLFQGRYRGGERPCLRDHDAGRRAAPQAKSTTRLRLRQPLRQEGQALPVAWTATST
jgi:hypothetical protein